MASTRRSAAGGSRGPAGGAAAARPDVDREQGQLCARVALDRQAREVRLLFVGELLGIAEYFVLATVHNRRQARAIRDATREALKAAGYGPPLASSEDPDGRWSLYDWGVVVLHLFDDEGRRHFDLDGLWAGATELPFQDSPSGATAESKAHHAPAESAESAEADEPESPAASATPARAAKAAKSVKSVKSVTPKPARAPRAKPGRGSER